MNKTKFKYLISIFCATCASMHLGTPFKHKKQDYQNNVPAEINLQALLPAVVDDQKSIAPGTVYALQTAINIYCKDVKKSTIDYFMEVLEKDNNPEHFKSLKSILDRFSSVLIANIDNESIQALQNTDAGKPTEGNENFESLKKYLIGCKEILGVICGAELPSKQHLRGAIDKVVGKPQHANDPLSQGVIQPGASSSSPAAMNQEFFQQEQKSWEGTTDEYSNTPQPVVHKAGECGPGPVIALRKAIDDYQKSVNLKAPPGFPITSGHILSSISDDHAKNRQQFIREIWLALAELVKERTIYKNNQLPAALNDQMQPDDHANAFTRAKFYLKSCSKILKIACNEGVNLSDSHTLQAAVGEVIDIAKSSTHTNSSKDKGKGKQNGQPGPAVSNAWQSAPYKNKDKGRQNGRPGDGPFTPGLIPGNTEPLPGTVQNAGASSLPAQVQQTLPVSVSTNQAPQAASSDVDINQYQTWTESQQREKKDMLLEDLCQRERELLNTRTQEGELSDNGRQKKALTMLQLQYYKSISELPYYQSRYNSERIKQHIESFDMIYNEKDYSIESSLR